MKCLLCGNEIPKKEDGSAMSFTAYLPIGNGSDQQMDVCGRCYLLSAMVDELKKISPPEAM
jgi:hypothetical protein